MKPTARTLDAETIVVGGGFFGCALALHLRANGREVALIERESGLMTRASLNNQARIHRGYHYPRSLRTGLRSRANYERFVADYAVAVVPTRMSVYAIARNTSRVNARQFTLFCDRIGAPIQVAGSSVREWFDPELIEAVFVVDEATFDATVLARHLGSRLADAGVEVLLDERVDSVRPTDGRLELSTVAAGATLRRTARDVFVCAYAATNAILAGSGLPALPMRRHHAEMALVDVPDHLHGVGITVMDGPYFSLLPFPSRPGVHTLSHVRFTPRLSEDASATEDAAAVEGRGTQSTAVKYMIQDARRYAPAIGQAKYVGSLYETKVLPPDDDKNDGRPILLHRPTGAPGLTFVVGGKIDNVYDVLQAVDVGW